MKNETKIFAFKLASSRDEGKQGMKWVAREGVKAIGCTGFRLRIFGSSDNDNGPVC